ncbi:hypothetical protein PIB30_036328 [Stylosanthes scabra]|uniref:Uncharacterized protein n=1 Tax=Stylosanthes scabra TaxID=79078 RepID=A0ABU6VBC3_9FABA|nr:hypothetical protein [Stylosanthes scabra]
MDLRLIEDLVPLITLEEEFLEKLCLGTPHTQWQNHSRLCRQLDISSFTHPRCNLYPKPCLAYLFGRLVAQLRRHHRIATPSESQLRRCCRRHVAFVLHLKTKYRFYQTWVKVRPVDSTKSSRLKANPTTLIIRLTIQQEPVLNSRVLKAEKGKGLGDVPLTQLLCLRGSSPMALNDHPFLTVDVVSLCL